MNISGLSDRSTEEWKERGLEEEEEEYGEGKIESEEEEVQSSIRVIKFGLCADLIRAPQISGSLTLGFLYWFNLRPLQLRSISLYFRLLSHKFMIKTSTPPTKTSKLGWDSSVCVQGFSSFFNLQHLNSNPHFETGCGEKKYLFFCRHLFLS